MVHKESKGHGQSSDREKQGGNDEKSASLDQEKESAAGEIDHSGFGDRAVLLDIQQGLCFSTNPVGSKIWETLKKEYSLDNIAERVASRISGASRAQIQADIFAFVAELGKPNSIREVHATSWMKKVAGFPDSSNSRNPLVHKGRYAGLVQEHTSFPAI